MTEPGKPPIRRSTTTDPHRRKFKWTPRNGQRATPAKIAVTQRREFVLKARLRGLTFAQIADAVRDQGLGSKSYSKAEASKDCDAAMAMLVAQPAEELRALQGARLAELQPVVFRKAMGGDLRAALALVRLMEREARLFQLDPPVRTEIELRTHFDKLAMLALQSIMAGLDSADLSEEQRQQIVDGTRRHLEEIEASEAHPRAQALHALDAQ